MIDDVIIDGNSTGHICHTKLLLPGCWFIPYKMTLSSEAEDINDEGCGAVCIICIEYAHPLRANRHVPCRRSYFHAVC